MNVLELSAVLFLGLILVPSVLGAGGVAPSGVGDRIEIGVERSLSNWLKLQIINLMDVLNPFDVGDRLESKGVTRVG